MDWTGASDQFGASSRRSGTTFTIQMFGPSPSGTPLAQRYLTTLTEQEDRIAAIDAQLVQARKAVTEAKKALTAGIDALSSHG